MSAHVVEPRPGVSMGRVVVSVAVENSLDRSRVALGEIEPGAVRRATVDALVDTGATFFCIPESLVRQLGIEFDRQRETRTISGVIAMRIDRGARIDVQGRACNVEVMALPEGRPCLLGQIPLETLDWWVDTANRRLAGKPEHGGQWMAEAF